MRSVLVFGLNRLLGQAAWARRELSRHAGRRAVFFLASWNFGIEVADEGYVIEGDFASGDVVIGLPFEDIFGSLSGVKEVFSKAHVSGNAEFATALSFVVRNLRWDLEEELSRVLGDIVAHRVFRAVSAFDQARRRGVRSFGGNFAEYFGVEGNFGVSVSEFADFRVGVRQLESGLSELDGRIAALFTSP